MTDPKGVTLGWLDVVRLGLVQSALGAIVVLTTSTLNRVMVVELALPALLPGLLVGLHYAVQLTRPRMGHGSDCGGRRTPWIVGGMLVLAVGGLLAAMATALGASHALGGIALATLAFVLVGLGVGCAGTSLLVLLATSVAPRWRGAAATTVWVMMIAGFIVTAIVAGAWLDPFSFGRLVAVSASVSAVALALSLLGVVGIERRVLEARRAARVAPAARGDTAGAADGAREASFGEALRGVWAEPEARRFSVFVFVAMLAYSAQDLVLEPFAGAIFGLTPGQSTQLSGAQHGGVLVGMLAVALATAALRGRRLGSLRLWTIGGCLASALVLLTLAAGGLLARESFALRPAVFALGVANGAFAVAAIGSMMALVGHGRARREGVRMGLWGAAQAVAFGLGGLVATGTVDLARLALADTALAYAVVFALQAAGFVVAAWLARGVYRPGPPERDVALGTIASGAVGADALAPGAALGGAR